MNARKSLLRAAALASTCLLPLAVAHAEDAELNNEISVGAKYQSEKSYMFGRYSGGWEKGGAGTADFHVKAKDDWNSGNTFYYDAFGRDLESGSNAHMPEASAGIKAGNQGKWSASLNYDAITYFQSDSFHTVYASGSGQTGGLIGSVPAGTFKSWQANLIPEAVDDVKTRRDRISATGKYDLGNGFSFSGMVFHEHKDGTMEQSMSMNGSTNNFFTPGNYNGSQLLSSLAGYTTTPNTKATSTYGSLVYFPQPIDYDTERYDAKLSYHRGDLQAELMYSYFNFSDNNLSFNAWDPFSAVTPAGTTVAAGALGQANQSAWSLPPSNTSHSVTADVGYAILPSTQISGTFQYAVQLANNPLPMSAQLGNHNLTLTSAQLSALANPVGNGNNWNTSAQTINGNLTVTSRPLPHLDIKAAYTINSYENQSARTPINASGSGTDATVSAPSLTQAQVAAYNCSGASVDSCTVPWAWTKQKASLDVGYAVLPGTRVVAGYAFTDTDRRYMMNDHSDENTLSLRANTRMGNSVFGNLAYEHSVRTANHFNNSGANSALEFSSYYAGNGGAAWFDTGRTADTVKSNVLWAATNKLSLGVNGQYVDEHYPSITVEGMDHDRRYSAGPQVTYRPTEAVSTNLYYNYERAEYKSRSMYGTVCQNTTTGAISAVNPSAAAPTAPCGAGTTTLQQAASWNQTNSDGTHTVGAGVEWQPIKDKLKISADYNFSYGDIAWQYADNLSSATLGVMNPYYQFAWAAQPIPNVNTMLSTLKLRGEYAINPRMSLWVGYTFERMMNNDYNNLVQQAAYASNLLSGDANPSYAVHVLATSLRVKF